ncbi:General transcription factor IIH subunit 2 [Linum perenne]
MDFKPSRMAVIAKHVEAFIREFFDQNPLSQIGLGHFKELLMDHAPPPPAIAEFAIANLIKMGFPQRAAERSEAMCSCHKEAKVGGNKAGPCVSCTKCKQYFCLDCDIYIHESLHNCPGCESLTNTKPVATATVE